MDWELINRLATACGVNRNTLYQWRNRGAVPKMYHLMLLDMARAARLDVSREALGIPEVEREKVQRK